MQSRRKVSVPMLPGRRRHQFPCRGKEDSVIVFMFQTYFVEICHICSTRYFVKICTSTQMRTVRQRVFNHLTLRVTLSVH